MTHDNVHKSGLWMYEWDGCVKDDQYDHILDSAYDHNIGFVINEDTETACFIANDKQLLMDWLKSFDVYDYDNVSNICFDNRN